MKTMIPGFGRTGFGRYHRRIPWELATGRSSSQCSSWQRPCDLAWRQERGKTHGIFCCWFGMLICLSLCIYIYIICIHPYSKTVGDLGVDSDLFWNKHRKKWEDCASWQVVFKGKARSRSTKQMGFPFKIVIFRRTLENHGCPIRCPLPYRKMGTTRDGSRPIKHEDAIK